MFTQYTFNLCIYFVTNLETQLTLHILSTRIQIQLKSTFKHDAHRQLAAINASDQSIYGKKLSNNCQSPLKQRHSYFKNLKSIFVVLDSLPASNQTGCKQ